MAQTIVCMRWGQRYGVDYVNRLWSMIRRHTRRPTRLVCYTDDTKGLDPAVEAYPLPEIRLPQRLAMLPGGRSRSGDPTCRGFWARRSTSTSTW